ncbi:hypothetical protein EV673_0369 [Limnobacter thiooxidans]|nr:hypothetical protein EV673_0369 [Limnobacter thiooxidans]
MIPTYVTWIADELFKHLQDRGFNLKVTTRRRYCVCMELMHPFGVLRIAVNSYETAVWVMDEGKVFDCLSMGFFNLVKAGRRLSCGCGGIDCKTIHFSTRRQLLKEFAIQPMIDLFHRFETGAYIDYFGIPDRSCWAKIRPAEQVRFDESDYIKSVWVSLQSPRST